MNVMKLNEMDQDRDPLGLGRLPPVEPGDDGWPAIESALAERNRRGRGWRMAGGSLAAAAAAVLALVMVFGRPAPDEPLPVESMSAAPPGQESQSAPLNPPALESLIAMSQQLEGRVRLYQEQLGDLPTDSLVYVVELQDLIVQVDEELSMNPDSFELWAQRVNLLLDVTQLYENSLRRDYHRMASL